MRLAGHCRHRLRLHLHLLPRLILTIRMTLPPQPGKLHRQPKGPSPNAGLPLHHLKHKPNHYLIRRGLMARLLVEQITLAPNPLPVQLSPGNEQRLISSFDRRRGGSSNSRPLPFVLTFRFSAFFHFSFWNSSILFADCCPLTHVHNAFFWAFDLAIRDRI